MGIKVVHLNHIYGKDTAFSQYALKDVNLEIEDGQFIGLIGHTGSGKSTLIQHLNGLLKADSGEIYFNGENIYQDGYNMKPVSYTHLSRQASDSRHSSYNNTQHCA